MDTWNAIRAERASLADRPTWPGDLVAGRDDRARYRAASGEILGGDVVIGGAGSDLVPAPTGALDRKDHR
jgi:hypothetical protein